MKYELVTINGEFVHVEKFETLGEVKRIARKRRTKTMPWVKMEILKDGKKMYAVIEKAFKVEFEK